MRRACGRAEEEGQRIIARTEYIWDELSDNVLMETDENDATTAVFTNEPGQFGGLVSQRRGAATNYHHFDAQHSTRQLTDASQNLSDTYTYLAFGETVAKTGTTTNPFGYKGALGYHANSESNDLYVRARTLKPAIGRWLSLDPLPFLDGPNPYLYALNSALTFADPTGLFCAPCCCCVESIAFDKIRDLKPGYVLRDCYFTPKKVGPKSFGHEFLVTVKFEMRLSNQEKPCGLEWLEISNEEYPTKPCVPYDAYKEFGEKVKTFKDWNDRMANAACPGKGIANMRDCPVTNEDRLLCIVVTVKSTCDSCAKKDAKLYVKQVCEKSKCEIQAGDTPQCTKADFDKWCPKKEEKDGSIRIDQFSSFRGRPAFSSVGHNLNLLVKSCPGSTCP